MSHSHLVRAIALLVAAAALGRAQDTFSVEGTMIPQSLVALNYGRLPVGVVAYDLSICNSTAQKQSVTSSQIFQALASAQQGVRPIGRQIMLAAILQNQRRSPTAITLAALTSAASALSIISSTRALRVSSAAQASTAIAGLALTEFAAQFRSFTVTPDKVEKFDREVLEPALVLDGGTCVERTVFGAAVGQSKTARPSNLSFHVR